MDKAEALDFIGLKEPISEEIVSDKYAERFNYFQMLYSNAPNKVVELIHQQNLQKLNQVIQVLLEEIAIKKKNFDKKHANRINKTKPEERKVEKKPVVIGWLIVHTENKKAETFNLYEGINYIGRKRKDDNTNNILIGDDRFVSRTHAFIKSQKDGDELQFMLYDGDGYKSSVNGVFLNGNDVKIDEHCLLKENDTIQIGTTKLVFKIKKDHQGITGELHDVLKTDFVRTINVQR